MHFVVTQVQKKIIYVRLGLGAVFLIYYGLDLQICQQM